jgi:hypothetical protein
MACLRALTGQRGFGRRSWDMDSRFGYSSEEGSKSTPTPATNTDAKSERSSEPESVQTSYHLHSFLSSWMRVPAIVSGIHAIDGVDIPRQRMTTHRLAQCQHLAFDLRIGRRPRWQREPIRRRSLSVHLAPASSYQCIQWP